MMQRTLVLIKPDGVQRGLVGDIITRFERKGFKLLAMKLLQVGRELAEKHYAVHRDKDFYADLVRFITSGPIVAMVVEGPDAIRQVRNLVGATSPQEAAPGTIRGDMAVEVRLNLIHASDAPETAAEEIANFFKDDELIPYSRSTDKWISSSSE